MGIKFDLAVCYNGFNALNTFFLKKIGLVKKVVFCTVDYAPQRYPGKIKNEIYHLIDRLAVYYSDEVWNLSPRMEWAREKYRGIKTSPGKQKVVPMGVWSKKKGIPFSLISKHTFVFVGHLLEKQGVQDFIKAVPEILKDFPDFILLVVGTGPYEKNLKELVKKGRLEEHILFKGHIPDYQAMQKTISLCACGIALYKKGDLKTNFTYYADPGKIKDYLSVGLPVLLTDIPGNAVELAKNGCGIITKRDPENIRKSVFELIGKERTLQEYRNNTQRFIEKLNWRNIFDKAIF